MKLVSRSKTRKVRHDLLYYFANLGYYCAKIIPRSFGLGLFGLIGAIIYCFPGADKKRTIQHLRFIYGKKWTNYKIRCTAKNVFVQLGKNLFDSIYLPGLNVAELDKIVTCDPVDELRGKCLF